MMLLLRLIIFTALLFIPSSTTLECNNHENVPALILARGGSKGIKDKNLAQINGTSLLARALNTIKASNCFKEIWVSTENAKIADEATKFGGLVHPRPKKYAQDETSSLASISEFLDAHKSIEKFALFQVTSPFLRPTYIREAVQKFQNSSCVFAVKRSHNLRWQLDVETQSIKPLNFDIARRPRRQDWAGEFIETGMFYLSSRTLVSRGLLQNESCAFVEIKDMDSLEIDTYNDLKIANYLVSYFK